MLSLWIRISFFGFCLIGAALPMAGNAEPIVPQRVKYDAATTEDPAAKACVAELFLQGTGTRETVNFQAVVARMKQNGAFAGPLIIGFRIEVRDPTLSNGGTSAARRAKIVSAAFVSEAYTAVAQPKIAPFQDGSLVASTLDPAEGGALVGAVAKGGFQVAFTRRQPAVARTYVVTSAAPQDVILRLGECIAAFAPNG